MKNRMIWRVALPFLVLFMISLIGLGLYLAQVMKNRTMTGTRVAMLVQARTLADQASAIMAEGNWNDLQELAERYAGLSGERVTFILPDGRVAADSDEDPIGMDNHANRPEVQDALSGQEATSIRISNTLFMNLLYAAAPVNYQENRIGVARIALPLKELESDLRAVNRTILGATLLTLLAAMVIALLLAQWMTAPIRALSNVVENGLQQPNPFLQRKDEIGELGRAFEKLKREQEQQIRELSAEREKLEAVLTHMTDGVLLVDQDGNVHLINPAAGRLFGIEPSDALGKSLIEVTRHHTFVELWRKCRVTGEPQTSTLETIPGHLIVQGTASVLGSTIPGGILLVFVDLTRIRKLEVVRRDFFSNVSHELRTPLASLKVIVETLQEGGLEDIPTARRFLEKMDIEIDNLIQMVREILELNRVESGRVPLNQQKVSPRVLVESAVGRMQPQAERAGINMVVDYQDPLSDVEVDANRIEQVLINLIHNAIKFTAPGGKITICVRQVSGMVEFTIEDTGAGIREEDLPRIFERFYKIDPSRAGGGTGLGLSIARHTVEAHGGRIWAESEYQKGSRFLFVLPAVVM